MAAKGDVKLIISDPGSQLKGASKELVSWRKGWDEQMLVRFGVEKDLECFFYYATLPTPEWGCGDHGQDGKGCTEGSHQVHG